jgi:hypothetical protein
MCGCLLKHFSYLISFRAKESIFLFMGEGNPFTDLPSEAADWTRDGSMEAGVFLEGTGSHCCYDDVGFCFLVATFVI